MLFMSCDCHAFACVHCCLVITGGERADLLVLVCDVYCDFVTLPFGTLGQVWYLIESIPDLCCPFYSDISCFSSASRPRFAILWQQSFKVSEKTYLRIFLNRLPSINHFEKICKVSK